MFNPSFIKTKSRAAEVSKSRGIGVGNSNPDSEGVKDRLPPGQRIHNGNNPEEFPVLDLGVHPAFNPETYTFEVTGLVANPISWSWDEVMSKIPKVGQTSDFHCVTRWSKYDIKWAGFKYLDLEKFVKPKPEAKFVVQYGLDGYTTNVPIEDLRNEDVLFAYELYGKPLPLDHGAPMRLIIPKLYGWKGSKFIHKIEFVAEDEPGFWEVRGYHNHGNPWKEERYG